MIFFGEKCRIFRILTTYDLPFCSHGCGSSTDSVNFHTKKKRTEQEYTEKGKARMTTFPTDLLVLRFLKSCISEIKKNPTSFFPAITAIFILLRSFLFDSQRGSRFFRSSCYHTG